MSHLEQTAQDVGRIYSEVDRAVNAFTISSKLNCIAGCGKCCLFPEIETTVLECLPAAFAAVASGTIEESFADLSSSESKCPWFRAGANKGQGSCTSYETRPLICRMFGQSATLDKSGSARLVTCSILKGKAGVDAKDAPLMETYSRQLWSLHPQLGKEFFPIRVAMQRAIELVQQAQYYQDAESPNS